MAELGVPAPAAAVRTKTANTRKHLRRDQAAARKARSMSLAAAADSARERMVSPPSLPHTTKTQTLLLLVWFVLRSKS